MARTFGSYSPPVPLGVTWEESLILEDRLQQPVDLSGYDVRAQFYTDMPIRDPDTGIATVPPVLEITSPDWYVSSPTWPVVEGADIPDPASQGLITIAVDVDDLWTFSPTNAKAKFFWSIVLVNPDTLKAIPVVEGRPIFLPARTI